MPLNRAQKDWINARVTESLEAFYDSSERYMAFRYTAAGRIFKVKLWRDSKRKVLMELSDATKDGSNSL